MNRQTIPRLALVTGAWLALATSTAFAEVTFVVEPGLDPQWVTQMRAAAQEAYSAFQPLLQGQPVTVHLELDDDCVAGEELTFGEGFPALLFEGELYFFQDYDDREDYGEYIHITDHPARVALAAHELGHLVICQNDACNQRLSQDPEWKRAVEADRGKPTWSDWLEDELYADVLSAILRGVAGHPDPQSIYGTGGPETIAYLLQTFPALKPIYDEQLARDGALALLGTSSYNPSYDPSSLSMQAMANECSLDTWSWQFSGIEWVSGDISPWAEAPPPAPLSPPPPASESQEVPMLEPTVTYTTSTPVTTTEFWSFDDHVLVVPVTDPNSDSVLVYPAGLGPGGELWAPETSVTYTYNP